MNSSSNRARFPSVLLNSDDLERCRSYGKSAWSRTGKAVRPGASDYDRAYGDAEFHGKAGEMGFGRLIGVEPDFEYRDGGDRYDFLVEGQRVDVKCTANRRAGVSYVLKESGGKKDRTPLDIVVCTSFREAGDGAMIEVLGFQTRRWIVRSAPVNPSPRYKDTKNWDLVWEDLQPAWAVIDWARGEPDPRNPELRELESPLVG